MKKFQRQQRALAITYALLVMNMRPALLGQMVNELYLLVPIALVVVVALTVTKGRCLVRRSNILLLLLVLLFALWIVLQITVFTPRDAYPALVLGITIPTVAVGAAVLLRSEYAESVLRAVVYSIILLSASQLATYVLLSMGLRDTILITEFRPSSDYGSAPTKLYFPFTFTLGQVWVAGVKIERCVGVFREPGLYQMYVTLSYFALDFVQISHKRALRALLLFAVILTVSTAGYGIFLSCFIYKQVMIRRRSYLLRMVGIASAILVLVWFAHIPWFGLIDKLERNTGRTVGITESIQLLTHRPLLGYGLVGGGMDRHYGVSLMTSLHSLGLIGIALYTVLTASALLRNYNVRTMVLWLPLFATLLVSQPLFEKSFTILMLFLDTTAVSAPSQRYGGNGYELPNVDVRRSRD